MLHWAGAAERGQFEVHREVGYVAGTPTYVLAGELALGEVLVGDLPRPTFSSVLSETASNFWFHIAGAALRSAEVHGRRGDATACLANATQAILCAGHGVLAQRREWALNEKRLVSRAGLDDVQKLFRSADLVESVDAVTAKVHAANVG